MAAHPDRGRAAADGGGGGTAGAGGSGSGSLRHYGRGARDALLLPAWVVGFSLLGIGSLAREVGYPLGATVFSTVLIWAAPAQVVFFGSLAAGVSLPLIAVAICLSSIRFLPMTISLLPLLRRPGQTLPMQILIAHFVAVTVWVESLRRLPGMPAPARLPYYFGFATACVTVSTTLTGIGWALSGTLPGPLSAALLFITPIYFLMALVAGARGAIDKLAIGLGFALAPVSTALVGRDVDLLAVGLVGGSIAYLVDRRLRRGRA